jgi:hypothetical protein
MHTGHRKWAVSFSGTIEWNSKDVPFKGTTPYVVANSSALTLRFTVKDTSGVYGIPDPIRDQLDVQRRGHRKDHQPGDDDKDDQLAYQRYEVLYTRTLVL